MKRQPFECFVCFLFGVCFTALDDSPAGSHEDVASTIAPAAQLNGNANNTSANNSNDNSSSLNNQEASSPKSAKAPASKRGVEELYDIPVGE